MAFKMDAAQLKLAEKLVILNDRAAGMLTRLYNIKKTSTDSRSRPAFFSDKSMEQAVKHITKKFPVVDTRANMSTFSSVEKMKAEVISSLQLYYYTFADLLELKDHIMQLLTTMDACQCQLDISLNYELTAGYLNLVVNLVSIMILLSRVEDRRVVLGIFNAAYDLSYGQSEASFPRLGQMVVDYENPLKKLAEDLGPLNRLMHSALVSLSPVYLRRNITADTWRNAHILSLTANPQQILYAAQTDTIACEYLSLDVMDRWIVLCVSVCHGTLLNEQTIYRLWQMALQMGLSLRIFRDENMQIHSTVQQLFDGIKGYHKRSAEVKDNYSIALQQSASIHAERRRFLRGALRELVLLMKDQPGLLGPKILFVWMALSFSRDEVLWLLRHVEAWPSSGKKSKTGHADESAIADRQLPELLHWLLELRQLVTKYSDVIQRYYLQYVTGYDSIMTSELIGELQGLGEEDAVLMHDFAQSIQSINSDTDLRALRLDWFRFQSRVSVSRSSFQLRANKRLAVVMNTNVFHLKMIDVQDEMLRETSDLSIYCFYQRLLERQWRACVSLPAQCRFGLSFARICAHFPSALHQMCPEERTHVLDKSAALCNVVLDELARSTTDIVGALCDYELRLADQTAPAQVAAQIMNQVLRSKGGKAAATAAKEAQPVPAGDESVRMDRGTLTLPDKLHTTLVELCAAVSCVRQLSVADHVFSPREYLTQHLEARFSDLLLAAANDGGQPRRPSQLLAMLESYANVLHHVDLNVTLDMTRLFSTALLQQSQPKDARERDTLTTIYTKWYLDVVLRRASTGGMVWSEHLQAMVASGMEQQTFAPEQYTDPIELRALSQLIGPYGVKYLSERLIWHVAHQIGELYKMVDAHREVLQRARTQFDSSDTMREVLHTLCTEPKDKKSNAAATSPADALLQRTAIAGQIFSFRDALHSALNQVVRQRLPFLVASYDNLFESHGEEGRIAMGELGAALGERGVVDSALVEAVRRLPSLQQLPPDEHYHLSCLWLVGTAICMPRMAANGLVAFRPSIRASLNNSHCVCVAVTTLAGALFHIHQRGDLAMRMKEFLALASSSVLRLAEEMDGREDLTKNQNTLYVLLEQMVQKSSCLTMDVLEACFPYNLVRTAYQHCYLQETL